MLGSNLRKKYFTSSEIVKLNDNFGTKYFFE